MSFSTYDIYFFISEEIFEAVWRKSAKRQAGQKIRKLVQARFKSPGLKNWNFWRSSSKFKKQTKNKKYTFFYPVFHRLCHFLSKRSKIPKLEELTFLTCFPQQSFENVCGTLFNFLGHRRRRRSTGWFWRHQRRGSLVSSPSTLSTLPCSSSHSGSPLSSQVQFLNGTVAWAPSHFPLDCSLRHACLLTRILYCPHRYNSLMGLWWHESRLISLYIVHSAMLLFSLGFSIVLTGIICKRDCGMSHVSSPSTLSTPPCSSSHLDSPLSSQV